MKYLRWILLCVLPCIGAVAETAASLPDDAPINLFVGDSRVLEVATTRIAVGNGKVLSAAPVSPQQVVLIGQAPGSTVLQLWLRDGSQRRIEVVVTASDLQATLRAVQGMLQGVEGGGGRRRGKPWRKNTGNANIAASSEEEEKEDGQLENNISGVAP